MGAFDRILAELELTPGEHNLFEAADNANSGQVSQARTLEALYTAKRQAHLVDRLIESNEKLSASNERHDKVLTWLTGALVFVGIAQVVATAIAP